MHFQISFSFIICCTVQLCSGARKASGTQREWKGCTDMPHSRAAVGGTLPAGRVSAWALPRIYGQRDVRSHSHSQGMLFTIHIVLAFQCSRQRPQILCPVDIYINSVIMNGFKTQNTDKAPMRRTGHHMAVVCNQQTCQSAGLGRISRVHGQAEAQHCDLLSAAVGHRTSLCPGTHRALQRAAGQAVCGGVDAAHRLLAQHD